MNYVKKNRNFKKNGGHGNFKHTAGRKKVFYKNNYVKDPIMESLELETTPISGMLRRTDKGSILLRPDRSYKPEESTIWVKQDLCRRYSMVNGCLIEGRMAEINGVRWVVAIDSINGFLPEVFRFRPRMNELPAVFPTERFHIGDSGDESMRAIELIAPIGKGSRALIVSPPKAGKTTILEKLARSIKDSEPKAHVIVLLIDERPEEVTQFKRALPDVDVMASCNDQLPRDHVTLLRTCMEQVRIELESGSDIVILLDSITRAGRAFNLYVGDNGKLMSGGLSPTAMEVPRQFFGLARKIEGGGSLTIIATALIDTNSRLDELVFQEFKGTGNCEIVLDRILAESRIFPAININKSGTRREELLYDPKEYQKIVQLRRNLSDETPKEAATALLDLIRRTKDNKDLLKSIK